MPLSELDLTPARNPGATLVVKTAPICEPFSLAQIKDHLKLTSGTSEDTALTLLGKGIRRLTEALLNKSIIEQTYTLALDNVHRLVPLPVKPATSVVTVKYIANWDADTEVLIPSTEYVFLAQRNAIVARDTWEAHRGYQSFLVEFKAGMVIPAGTSDAQILTAQAAVPQDLVLGMLNWVGHVYENREGQGIETKFASQASPLSELPANVRLHLMNYMDWSLTGLGG